MIREVWSRNENRVSITGKLGGEKILVQNGFENSEI